MADGPDSRRPAGRRHRVRGVLGLAWERVRTRALYTAPRRTWASVAGVALAVALLLVVTGLAVGIAGPTAAGGEANERWIVPDGGGADSQLVAAGEPRLGAVHRANERLAARDGVRYSTPVLIQPLQVETADGGVEYVVAVGVIPDADERVMGVSTAAMTPGSPYYANGSYDGEWTGEVVLTEGGAATLDAAAGEDLTLRRAGDRPLTVADVDASASGDVLGTAPVAVMHLGELQAITGADEGDLATQFFVRTDGTAPAALEGLYPETTVLSGAELTARQVLDSDLALALGLAAVVVAVLVGSLFITTTMSLEVAADRRQLLTLASIGVSRRTRLAVYAVQTLVLAVAGGALGGVLGLAGVRLTNAVAARFFPVDAVAESHPAFLLYGLAAALLVGLLSLPVLVVVAGRIEADAGGDRARA